AALPCNLPAMFCSFCRTAMPDGARSSGTVNPPSAPREPVVSRQLNPNNVATPGDHLYNEVVVETQRPLQSLPGPVKDKVPTPVFPRWTPPGASAATPAAMLSLGGTIATIFPQHSAAAFRRATA